MTISELYKNCEFILNKTTNGNIFSPVELNLLLKSIVPNMFKDEAEKVLREFGSYTEGLYSSKMLRQFRHNENVTPLIGSYMLTGLANSFFAFLGAYTTAENVGRKVDVILVNHEQWRKINSSYIGKPTADYIIARISGNVLQVAPSTTGQINLDYLYYPTIPSLDYYIDANDNIIPLAAGATGISVPAGGTSSAGVAGPTTVNSSTVEIPFSADYHHKLLMEVLKALGVRVDSNTIMQYANNEEQIIEQR